MIQIRGRIVLLVVACAFLLPFYAEAQQGGQEDTVAYTAGFYRVKDKGITIEDVAKLFKVNPQIIVKLNNYSDPQQILPAGRSIKIPVYLNGYKYEPEKTVGSKKPKTKAKTSAGKGKRGDAAQGRNEQYNFELAKSKLLLVEATLELNEALQQGIKASLDSLNIVDKNVIDENDIKVTLHRMQRQRDRSLLKPYFMHMQDSLKLEESKLETQKQSIESGLKPEQLAEINGIIAASPPTAVALDAKAEPETKEVALTTSKPETPAPAPILPNPQVKKVEEPVKAQPLDIVTTPVLTPAKRNTASSSTSDMPTKNEMPPPPSGRYERAHALEPILDSSFWQSSPDIVLPENDKPDLASTDTSAYVSHFSADNGLNPDNDIMYSVIVDSLNRLRAELYLTKANKSIAERNMSAAEQALKKSIDLDPHYYDAWSMLADLHVRQGYTTKAINEYKICAKIDSSSPRLYGMIGNAYLKLKMKPEAFDYFERSVKLDSNYTPGLMGAASILISRQQYPAAIAMFSRILKLNKNNHKSYKLRGIAEYLNGNYAAAIDDFTRYLGYDDTDPAAYYYRGVAKIARSQYQEACADLSTSSQLGYTAAKKVMDKNCAQKQ